MDIIKLPYTSYLELNVKDFSEFIQNELLEENVPKDNWHDDIGCLLYTSPSPRDRSLSRMPSSA